MWLWGLSFVIYNGQLLAIIQFVMLFYLVYKHPKALYNEPLNVKAIIVYFMITLDSYIKQNQYIESFN